MNVAIKYRVWLAGLFLSSMSVLMWHRIGAERRSLERTQLWAAATNGQHLEEVGIQGRTSKYRQHRHTRTARIAKAVWLLHTARIGGYAIEGAMYPLRYKRLLKEKAPRRSALAVPGMPIGSPGMDGPLYGDRKDPYDVLLIHVDGQHQRLSSYR